MKLKTLDELNHQTQPCKSSCYATCIAMALGVEVGDLIKEILEEAGLEPPHSNREIIPFLVRRNIYPEKLDGIMRIPLIDNCPLLITTLSKNNIQQLHCVLVYHSDEFDNFVLLDPCEGRENSKHYTDQEWLDGEVPIYEMVALYDCDVS